MGNSTTYEPLCWKKDLIIHGKDVEIHKIKPCPAKLIYLNFQPLEVVSRYRDPQPQVVEK